MSDVSPLGESYTMWLNADGEPVAKPLGAMSRGEVAAALVWAQEEEQRLARIAVPWARVTVVLEREAELDIGGGGDHEGDAALRAAGEAAERLARLQSALHQAMPRWSGSPLAFKTALRRWWPRR